MLIHEITEPHAWERFTGSTSNRVWFNSLTGQAITANAAGNHSVAISNNPTLFGLTPDDLSRAGLQPGEQSYDYDGRVLYPAMQRGWVRIYINPKQPDISSNAEGVSLSALRRGLIWYSEQVGTPRRFMLVLRHGSGDRDGSPHLLKDADEIEWFIRKGTLPHERMPMQEPTAQVRSMNTTPHMFRKL